MARIFKILLVFVASVVGLVIVASIAVFLFFDPNDYRQEIAAEVKDATGRDLTIEGELSLSLFPWLAVEVGSTELGNARGFGKKPFMRFENASLSMRLVPLLLRQEVSIGTASIEGLVVNLAVAEDGKTNWDDLAGSADSAPAANKDSAATPAKINVDRIRIIDANVAYKDDQAGANYTITNLNFLSDGIVPNRPFDMEASFNFKARPEKVGGSIEIRGTTTLSDGVAQISLKDLNVSGEINGVTAETAAFNFDAREISIDTVTQKMSPGEMDFTVLGVSVSAKVKPFSYAGNPQAEAELRVAEFSLKKLMKALDVEPPVTADQKALSRVSFSANAALGEEALTLKKMNLKLDDSTMTGNLSLPTTADGAIGFKFNVDTINLDNYMAPADASAATTADEPVDDIEIPVDMIRSLNAEGSFTIDEAFLSGMEFTKIKLALQGANGKLRLHPLEAHLYDGMYSGDVRINAAKDVPSLSVNEKLEGVNMASLAKAMFEQENISGTINGTFALTGSGRNLAAIRKKLNGDMSFELVDGAWEGTDIWYQLRSARATFRREEPPRQELPARTEFTTMSATGTVTDGIFQNDDLLVELPFLRITGSGTVDLSAAEINYSLEARGLNDPKLSSGMSAAELKDFTRTVVPVKITGPLASPSIRPDMGAVFKQQVEGALEDEKEKLKNSVLQRLLGGEDAVEDKKKNPNKKNKKNQAGSQSDEAEESEQTLEDELKNKLLKDLIGR